MATEYPLEKEVKKQVKALLEKYHAYWLMPMTFGYGQSGHADFIGFINGHPFAVETKSKPTYEPTPTQYRRLKQAYEAGGSVFLIHAENLGELEAWLKIAVKGEVEQYVFPRLLGYIAEGGI